MALVIAPQIEDKIGADDHGNVTAKEVQECFQNHCGGYCDEQRPEHQNSDGLPSLWFVAETNKRRVLKIMFVRRDGNIHLKSAYPATDRVRDIFKRKCR